MSGRLPTIAVYHAALLDYVLRSDESGLAHAYELGRSGFDSGCGLLQILHVHDKALGIILDSTPVDDEIRRRVNASVKFLVEALSPYEMAFHGYRDLLKTR
ncbi:MAG TPA: phosphatase RsbU N-terminal domain-containing protein [Thermoanaerobaculia bacterium]